MLRFQKPSLPSGEAIEGYLSVSREASWFSNFGPCCELLSARLTEATGRPAVPVANATLGLIAALAVLKRRAARGADEVLLPSFAFAATGQAVYWNGLRPVFLDVDPEHWHLDPSALEQALESRRGRVAAVIALSSFGVPPPSHVRDQWEYTCKLFGVPLLVDSAAGFGAIADDGVAIGAQGDVEVVSFHALKPVSAGEGGVVFCRDQELAEEVVQLVNFAFDDQHRVLRPDGLNAKLSEPASAVALASLDKLPVTLEARRSLAARIVAALPESFSRQEGYDRGTFQFVQVTAPSARVRDSVLRESQLRSIGVRTYYDPLHAMPGFAEFEIAGPLTATSYISARSLSLPMSTELTEIDVAAIGAMVDAAVARAAVQAA